MKKNLIALLIAGALLFSVSPGVFSADSHIMKDPDLGELD
ncbi:hypothetical protein JOC34_003666 [Virgibacillus halotolerans]|nr:hypothetical protein [Virgibacillus halotolerans]